MGNLVQGLSSWMVKVFGSRNERVIKGMLDTVEAVNRLEPAMRKLSDSDLSGKTQEFRNRLADAFKGTRLYPRGGRRELEKLLPEAFAVVREASRRVLRTPSQDNPRPMRHFDVQLIGGMVLHSGSIAEMVTGEGKNPRGHPGGVSERLARSGRAHHHHQRLPRQTRPRLDGPALRVPGPLRGRDPQPAGLREQAPGLWLRHHLRHDSEFGFDYLRDNMRWSLEEQVQRRGLYYCIVDEVDSVLIDEARTPLIISGPSEESTDKYYVADRVARKLKKDEHFTVKEKEQSAQLTEAGIQAVEHALKVGQHLRRPQRRLAAPYRAGPALPPSLPPRR